jgi:hypothetical protein
MVDLSGLQSAKKFHVYTKTTATAVPTRDIAYWTTWTCSAHRTSMMEAIEEAKRTVED